MNKLNVIVKREFINDFDNKGYLIMFYVGYNKNKPVIECFTFLDGHNVASLEYLVSLWNPSKEEAIEFISEVQTYYDSLPDNKTTLVLKDVLILK